MLLHTISTSSLTRHTAQQHCAKALYESWQQQFISRVFWICEVVGSHTHPQNVSVTQTGWQASLTKTKPSKMQGHIWGLTQTSHKELIKTQNCNSHNSVKKSEPFYKPVPERWTWNTCPGCYIDCKRQFNSTLPVIWSVVLAWGPKSHFFSRSN